MIGWINSHNISEYKNEKILAVSRLGIHPNMSTFHWVLSFTMDPAYQEALRWHQAVQHMNHLFTFIISITV